MNDLLNFLGRSTLERTLAVLLISVASYWLYRLLIEPMYISVRGVWNFWRLRNRPQAILEITPPVQTEKSPLATEQLFAILGKALSHDNVISLELDATHDEGIRYLIYAEPESIMLIQRHITSYLPEASFRVLKACTYLDDGQYGLMQIRQRAHYAYPLQRHDDLDKADPVAFIAGSMTKLKPGDHIVMQLVITPHYSYWTNRLHSRIVNQGYAIIDNKGWHFIRSRPLWVWALFVPYYILTQNEWVSLQFLGLLVFVSLFITPREEPTLSKPLEELYTRILDKLSQPLFKTDVRIVVKSSSTDQANHYLRGLHSSLAPLNAEGEQILYTPRFYLERLGWRLGIFKALHRMPSFWTFNSNIFSASELASIFHFPYGTIKTEGMMRSHSRSLPVPVGMKNNDFDVVLGQSNYGEAMPIGLTAAERERHVFVIGGTGSGKTTMLQYAIVQDIQNGKGVAVVDPHGDMAETLLRHIPEERIDDVIYFNPDDLAHPIGLNLLELTPGLEGDDLLREKDLVTESVVSVFRKIFSDDDTGGHRIEYVLRNAIQTALCVEDATLFTVYDLLNDPTYRKQVLKQVDDKNLQNFWRQELGKAGDMQKVKMAAGITAKIGRFLFSASAKRILEQPRSTINFSNVLDGKILICNFSKGLIGEDTSELFGIAVLAKLQLASLQRARIRQVDRKPFYLYVDEFQNFATPSFVQMLSEARKYKLYLTMAEQSTSQQDDQQMVNVILANVGTVICFRSGNPADERLTVPLFRPYIDEGEIANLPSYTFYMRVAAQKAQEPLSGQTVVLEETGNKVISKEVIDLSRKHYASRKNSQPLHRKPKKAPKELPA